MKWNGYDSSENTWEKRKDLIEDGFYEDIKGFESGRQHVVVERVCNSYLTVLLPERRQSTAPTPSAASRRKSVGTPKRAASKSPAPKKSTAKSPAKRATSKSPAPKAKVEAQAKSPAKSPAKSKSPVKSPTQSPVRSQVAAEETPGEPAVNANFLTQMLAVVSALVYGWASVNGKSAEFWYTAPLAFAAMIPSTLVGDPSNQYGNGVAIALVWRVAGEFLHTFTAQTETEQWALACWIISHIALYWANSAEGADQGHFGSAVCLLAEGTFVFKIVPGAPEVARYGLLAVGMVRNNDDAGSIVLPNNCLSQFMYAHSIDSNKEKEKTD